LLVETADPVPPGTPLEIEIDRQPARPGHVWLVRGYVAWTRPTRLGWADMAIHLALIPAQTASVSVRARPCAAAARRANRALAEAIRSSPSADMVFTPEAPAPDQPPAPRRTRRRWMAALALLLLLLLLEPARRSVDQRVFADALALFPAVPATGPATPPGETPAAAPGPHEEAWAGAWPPIGLAEFPEPGVQNPRQRPGLDAPRTAGIRPAFSLDPRRAPARDGAIAPLELAESGPRGIGEGPDAAPPGADAGPSGPNGNGARALPRLYRAYQEVPLALVISKSAYRLGVYRHGRLVRTYPVGTGRDGATPEGAFTVANRIENPTWYNRGDPIPPGDPRNPLGSQWLGLGRDGVATPFGLHATGDDTSIGAAESAGCIRLRPEDMAALFAQCAVGTPIDIVP